MSSSAKLASFSTTSARGGDAGGGMDPPPASSAARSAAAAASDSHPLRTAAFGGFERACVACIACIAPSNANVESVVIVVVVVVVCSGVGSKARHEGVATGGSCAVGRVGGVASAKSSSQSSSTSLSVFFERAGDERIRGDDDVTASDDVAELARCSSPWPLSCLLDTLPMIPSSRLCFAASASRRLCSNAAGIWRGSGEEGVEMSDSSRARAPSPEAGKRSRGDGGFDRLLTFSSGLPLPDPLASPRAEERARSPVKKTARW